MIETKEQYESMFAPNNGDFVGNVPRSDLRETIESLLEMARRAKHIVDLWDAPDRIEAKDMNPLVAAVEDLSDWIIDD